MENRTDNMIDQMYLGHRIHFNWPLVIILAWLTLVLYSALNQNHEDNECTYPVTQGFDE